MVDLTESQTKQIAAGLSEAMQDGLLTALDPGPRYVPKQTQGALSRRGLLGRNPYTYPGDAWQLTWAGRQVASYLNDL